MAITPVSKAVNMKSIVAMLYDVKNVEGHPAPTVVGNTRGAVIANDIMFAGLETPMGKNTVLSETSGLESFTPMSWTQESFTWTPGDDTPAAILNLKTIADNKAITADNVVGTRSKVCPNLTHLLILIRNSH